MKVSLAPKSTKYPVNRGGKKLLFFLLYLPKIDVQKTVGFLFQIYIIIITTSKVYLVRHIDGIVSAIEAIVVGHAPLH